MPTHTLTREHLYDQIWSRPMVHVAKEHGLSDRGLAKLCVRHEEWLTFAAADAETLDPLRKARGHSSDESGA